MTRAGSAACAVAVLLCLGGCYSPLVRNPSFMGLGGFSLSRTHINAEDDAWQVRGFGVYARDGALGVGWIDQTQLRLAQTQAGTHVIVGEDEIATGAVAEHLASGRCGPTCQRWVPISGGVRLVIHDTPHSPIDPPAGFTHTGGAQ